MVIHRADAKRVVLTTGEEMIPPSFIQAAKQWRAARDAADKAHQSRMVFIKTSQRPKSLLSREQHQTNLEMARAASVQMDLANQAHRRLVDEAERFAVMLSCACGHPVQMHAWFDGPVCDVCKGKCPK